MSRVKGQSGNPDSHYNRFRRENAEKEKELKKIASANSLVIMDTIKKNFGIRLHELRKTIREVSASSGYAEQKIKRILNSDSVSLRLLCTLAKCVDMQLIDLMDNGYYREGSVDERTTNKES